MGIFSRSSGSSGSSTSRKSKNTPVHTEPVLSREELTAITKAQRSGNPSDPGRGPVQSTAGRSETVIT